jgi:hypothetical protein
MSAIPSHVPSPLRSVDPRSVDFSVRQWLGQVPLSIAFAASDQVGTDRTITITVLNLSGEACKGLFHIRVIVGTAADGGPAGTQTVSVVSGAQVASVVSNQVIDALTNSSGVLGLTVGVGSAGTRHIRAVVDGIVYGSGEISWV